MNFQVKNEIDFIQNHTNEIFKDENEYKENLTKFLMLSLRNLGYDKTLK